MIYSSLLFGALLGATSASRTTYTGSSILRCRAADRAQLDFLHGLELKNDMQLDFWQEAKNLDSPVDVMVSGQHRAALEAALVSQKIDCTTMMADVEARVEAERKENSKLHSAAGSSFVESYHDYNEVHAYFDTLAEEFPSLAATSSIGKTYWGKNQKIISMSTAPGTKKPTLWFDGGLHAREWISVATMTYVADYLLRGYGTDSDATYLLDTYDVIICPILNVDGYDWTWTDDRMWRKTLSPNTGSPCNGTDPNRNWAFHWGEAGTSDMACSDSYQGTEAASEIEVQNVQNYLFENKETLVGYINFHSYSQDWMSPWGYTEELPPDYTTQNALSEAAVAAIKATHGKTYEYGPIATTVYPASGSSADYVYGVCGVKYSYGAELRDTGEYGFMLPADQIVPQGEEIWAALIAMGQYIQANP
jgi:murein tripeptide amidase MpaA